MPTQTLSVMNRMCTSTFQKSIFFLKFERRGFPSDSVVKNPPASEGDTDSNLVWKDPTCHEATKPVCLNYSVCAPEPRSRNY